MNREAGAEASKPDDDKLRLELDAPSISLAKFASATNAFADLVQHISRNFGGGKPIDWTVEAERGSLVIVAQPQVDPGQRSPIISAIVDGVESIETRAEQPPYFDEQALQKARTLASLSTAEMTVRIRNGHRRTQITSHLIANVDEVTGEAPPRIGSIEGRLEAINVHGKATFAIWERLTGTRVECYVADQDTVDKLGQALKHRVEVRGRIRASKTGTKRRMDVKQLRIFASEEALPSADDVRGILRAS
jgi:hypothetical protein